MLRVSLWFCLISSVVGLEDNVIEFSLDFFKTKEVGSVCFLTCGEKAWNQKFAKYASKISNIAVVHVSLDESSLDIASIERCLNKELTITGVLIDTKCSLYEEVILYASQNRFFADNRKWLLVDADTWISSETNSSGVIERNENMTWLIETFEMLNLSINADVTLFLQKGSQNNIYEVFNFGKIRGGNTIVKYVGSWKNRAAWKNQLVGYKYYRRWDFGNYSLNLVAVMSSPPKVFDLDMIIGDFPDPGVAIVTVTATRILHELSQLHNIRFNYTILDRWIGDFKRNSSRVVANSLYFKEQDITPLLRIPAEIFKKLDMASPPLTSIETRYYYRIPTTGPGKFENQFLQPLTLSVWGCVTAVISLCAGILFLMASVERRPAAAQYAVFSVAAAFCQQFFEDGVAEPTRESSGALKLLFLLARQLTLLVTGASCVLIYNYYTSSVVSWLLSGPPPSINSLEELLESQLSLIFQDVGYTRSWLQNPNYYYNKKNAEVEDKLRKFKVFQKKKGEPLLVPLEQGIEMVKAGGFAYHTEVYNANKLISRTFTQEELCELGSLQSMEKTDLYVAIPKESPYKEFFNWNLLRLHETGVVSRVQRATKSPEISCEGSSPRALALGGAAPAFLLLAFGYLLAIVIVLMERFITRSNLKYMGKLKMTPNRLTCENCC